MPNKIKWLSFAFLVNSENKEITTPPIRWAPVSDSIAIKIEYFKINFFWIKQNKIEHKNYMERCQLLQKELTWECGLYK